MPAPEEPFPPLLPLVVTLHALGIAIVVIQILARLLLVTEIDGDEIGNLIVLDFLLAHRDFLPAMGRIIIQPGLAMSHLISQGVRPFNIPRILWRPEEIDLKNPKTNKKNAGFTQEERDKFTELLNAGFVDSFRYLNPELAGAYTWWSYRFKAREKDAGWRIDYFVVSECWKEKIQDAVIYKTVMGSDHCPIGLEI